MPVYEYACTECGDRLEARQSFTDEALTTCPVCGGRLRKLLSPVGVVFKGSGFYRNDSRGKPPTEGTTTTADGDKTAASSGSAGGSTDSTDGKAPSAPKPSTTPSSSGNGTPKTSAPSGRNAGTSKPSSSDS
jgi:putative FmdB family regulatory protein